MSIRNWPDAERPREKLIARGGAALSDAELLAVFLGSGRRGQRGRTRPRADRPTPAASRRCSTRRARGRSAPSPGAGSSPRSSSAGAISMPR